MEKETEVGHLRLRTSNGDHNEVPLGQPPTKPPPATRPAPIHMPMPCQAHEMLEKQVFEKLGDILYAHHREVDALPKLGGQSALIGEAVTHKEILLVMEYAAKKFFAEMFARNWKRRDGNIE